MKICIWASLSGTQGISPHGFTTS